MSFANSVSTSEKNKVQAEKVPGVRPKAVIIGGGYAGSQMALKLDSIFDVVLIDNKNFFNNYGHAAICEYLTSDLIDKSLRKLSLSDGEIKQVKNINNRCFPLHRYYLKNANVIVGEVEDIHQGSVTVNSEGNAPGIRNLFNVFTYASRFLRMSSQRSFPVPYDILFLATGEKLSFPFQSTARNRHERISELQDLMKYIEARETRKLAILGGGPCGVSLAKMLSENFANNDADTEIHLFASSPSLLPSMPKRLQKKALEDLDRQGNVRLSLQRKVLHVSEKCPGNTGESIWNAMKYLMPSKSENSSQPRMKYSIEHIEAPQSNSYWTWHRGRSLLHHLFFGKRAEFPNRLHCVPENASRLMVEDYDYVFDCTGAVPRIDSPLFKEKPDNNFFKIKEHLTEDGYFHVNQFFQLYSHPNIFAIGRCVSTSSSRFDNKFGRNAIVDSPYNFGQETSRTHSLSSSHAQVDYVFNHILAVLESQATAKIAFSEFNLRGFTHHNSFFHYWPPRLMIPFGKSNAIGITGDYPYIHYASPFLTGGRTRDGNNDSSYLDEERNLHCKEYVHPKFYRQKDAHLVAQNFRTWLAYAKSTANNFMS